MKRTALFAMALAVLAGVSVVPRATGQVASPPAAGIIQGTVVREGTGEPIPDVQITVTGSAVRVNPTIMGPTGQPITLTPAMAQQLIDAVANNDPNIIGMPREYVEVAQDVLRAAGRGGAAQAGGPTSILSAVTDSNGRFRFTEVPAGNVTVKAQSLGFFAPPVNGYYGPTASVTAVVSANAPVDVRVTMIQGGTISGRVVDAAGKPLSDTPVQALQRAYSNGNATFTETNIKQTDDRGEYRLYRLPPGEYFLAVNPRRPPLRGNNRSGEEIPVFTMFPGVSNPSMAERIVLRGGEELSGYNFQLKSTLTSRVSGKVVSTVPPGPALNPQGQVRPSTPNLFIARRDTLGLSLPDYDGGETIAANADGSFELNNVLPGAYEIFARVPIAANTGWGTANPPARAGAPWAFGRTAIDVLGGTDVNDVVVTIRTGFDLKGRILVDGRAAAADLRITVLPVDSAANHNDGPASGVFSEILQFSPVIESGGIFTIPLLPEGQYRFLIGIGNGTEPSGNRGGPTAQAAALPATAYVADIRQRGVSVYDNGLTVIAPEIEPVDVFVSTDGSSIEGVVTDKEQKRVAAATVVLVPPQSRRQNPMLYKTARSDAQGHFVIDPIPPGAYTVFVWENPPASAWQNAEFLARYAQQGTPINVMAGARTSVAVGVIRDAGEPK